MAVHDIVTAWVTPDWLPLALVAVLLLVIGGLYWSMRRHISRINIPGKNGSDADRPND